MRTFIHKVRYFALALALALAIQPVASVTTAQQAEAGGYGYMPNPPMMSPAVVGGGGSTAGGWIVGGLFISVASIIACAMIVGSEEGRELTLDEAIHAGLIPLHCLFDLHLDDE